MVKPEISSAVPTRPRRPLKYHYPPRHPALGPYQHPVVHVSKTGRKLVTVRRITHITRISKGLDLVFVGKTSIPVPRGVYNPRELVLFCDVGSVLPTFRFAQSLSNSQDGDPKIVRAHFSNGHLCAGEIFALRDFPEVLRVLERLKQESCESGAGDTGAEAVLLDIDFTTMLNVKELTMPESESKYFLGTALPCFIPNTRIPQLSTCPNLFIKSKYDRYIYHETAKMDGCSMTYYFIHKQSRYYNAANPLPEKIGDQMIWPNGRFGVCSKSREMNQIGGDRAWKVARNSLLPEQLAKMAKSVAIMGELVGWDIEGNRHRYADGEHNFFVFAMFDIDKQQPIHPDAVFQLAKTLGLDHVPILGKLPLTSIANTHDALLDRAARVEGEGLVFRCTVTHRCFKVHSRPYLEKHGLLKKGDKHPSTL